MQGGQLTLSAGTRRGVAGDPVAGVIEEVRLGSVTAVVSAACNLRCRYCYQNRHTAGPMTWPVLRAAIDRLLAGPDGDRSLLFTGGEPLLSFPLIEKAVGYVKRRRLHGRRVTYDISTNGTLVRRRHVAFFAANRFAVQLSFDGVPAAQAIRGKGTFAALDALLDLIRAEEPALFRHRLRVAVTVTRDVLPYLAGSVDYLLSKRVHEITLAPDLRPDVQWTASEGETLDRQMAGVFASSLHHYRRTGDVPLLLFRKSGDERPIAARRGPVCRAAEGGRITVDVDGQVYACPMLAESFQVFPDTPLRERLAAMHLGDIRDAAFPARLRALPEAARRSGIFHHSAEKYSSRGRCARCRFRSACTICPVPVARDVARADSNRVLDHLCEFNRIALSYRARFPRQVSALDVLSGRASFASFLSGVRS